MIKLRTTRGGGLGGGGVYSESDTRKEKEERRGGEDRGEASEACLVSLLAKAGSLGYFRKVRLQTLVTLYDPVNTAYDCA